MIVLAFTDTSFNKCNECKVSGEWDPHNKKIVKWVEKVGHVLFFFSK